jgi:hypothetical protein
MKEQIRRTGSVIFFMSSKFRQLQKFRGIYFYIFTCLFNPITFSSISHCNISRLYLQLSPLSGELGGCQLPCIFRTYISLQDHVSSTPERMLCTKFCCYAKEPVIIRLLKDQRNHVILCLRIYGYSLNTFAKSQRPHRPSVIAA